MRDRLLLITLVLAVMAGFATWVLYPREAECASCAGLNCQPSVGCLSYDCVCLKDPAQAWGKCVKVK